MHSSGVVMVSWEGVHNQLSPVEVFSSESEIMLWNSAGKYGWFAGEYALLRSCNGILGGDTQLTFTRGGILERK
jgi:hypothetical protein